MDGGYCVERSIGRCRDLGRSPSAKQLSGAERLRATIEDLGGTFIKFGQMLALQPDVLSPAYCEALLALLDRGPAFDFKEVEQTFQEDLGKPPLSLFDSFDQKPFATGSVGQVHLAVRAGKQLAIKVRRPTVVTDFSIDLRLIARLINLIKWSHLQTLAWLIEPLSEFVSWTSEELDYRREASYMEELGANAQSNPSEKVPRVFWEYTTERILAVEFMEGATVLDYIRANGSSPFLSFVPAR
jgi:ubiquinone biosynthesis protein